MFCFIEERAQIPPQPKQVQMTFGEYISIGAWMVAAGVIFLGVFHAPSGVLRTACMWLGYAAAAALAFGIWLMFRRAS